MCEEQQSRTGPRPLREPNPLLAEWQRAAAAGQEQDVREAVVAEYGFSIPTDAALATIGEVSPSGVVEIGAGTGYWARLLAEAGVDVVAFDAAPAPQVINPWFAGVAPWFDVAAADHTAVSAHGDRTLLIVWPTKNEEWAAECLRLFADADGETVVYVGDGPGGRTGDDTFHALLGGYDRCWQCAVGVQSVPCLCGIRPMFTRTGEVTLPSWSGFEDALGVFVRDTTREPIGPRPARHARRRPRFFGIRK